MAEEVNTYQGEENPIGTPEQVHNAMASMDEPIQASDTGFSEDAPQTQNDSRPEWLPEKFGSPQELAQAYKSLEQQFHSNQEQTTQQEQEKQFQEDIPQIQETTSSQVHKMLDERGLDFSTFQDEYNEKGELSKDAYEALQEAGIDKNVVDTWIEGQQARAEQNITKLYGLAGGDISYNKMLEWAGNNLTPAEADAFNKQIDNVDVNAELAVAGLYARYQNSEGVYPSPTLLSGDINVATQPRYESLAQVTSDMSDPRYQTDPAFRSKVAARLQNSSVL